MGILNAADIAAHPRMAGFVMGTNDLAKDVGARAAERLLAILNSGAAVDSHLADNLIPLLALRGGAIRTEEITGHIRSNVYVCEKFLGVRFEVDDAQKVIRLRL